MVHLIETIYLIHHSHVDIGYTQDAPTIWELQSRFMDEAIALAERDQYRDTDGAFRWTVETTGVLQYWLRHASDADISRFIDLEKQGRIEVTGMFANLTPLVDTDEFIESFQIVRRLRDDYGLTIENAMNCDVNGHNWSLTDVLLDLGITGFSMATNTYFGGAVQPCPHVFNWQSPSGRRLRVNNGWRYDKAWREGIGRDAAEFAARWQRLQAHLGAIGYPLPIVFMQGNHPFGDNGTAFDYTSFIDAWNREHTPRIVLATPRMWWDAVARCSGALETLRGDWTDYWNFGSGSSAHETRINRLSRARLRTADALYAVAPEPLWVNRTFSRFREEAWWNLILWDEHSWGADTSVSMPDDDDARSQWYQKADYAHKARSLSTLLQRDALADFARRVARDRADDILLFNPLPWSRTVAGFVPYFVSNPRGEPTDTTAGRHHQDRTYIKEQYSPWHPGDQHLIAPTKVPAFGYTIVPRSALHPYKDIHARGDDAVVNNHRYRVTFDRDRGGILSLYDRLLEWELVNSTAGWRLNSFVHETVDDTRGVTRERLYHHDWSVEWDEVHNGWQTDWDARREGAFEVLSHKVYQLPYGLCVQQELRVKGADGVLTQQVLLPDHADYIECSAHWRMTLDTDPQATYLVFPFALPGATARYDAGGQSVIAGEEQLPGACRDYFTVQGWVDFNDGARGVRVATPENPLVQLSDFHFGHDQTTFSLKQATFLGWVTNNYWDTNFRAHQPGRVQARYRIQPYAGAFDEPQAHRFGVEALHEMPVFQHLGEPRSTARALPGSGSLLMLPDAPIHVLHIKKAENGDGMIIRLLNASDEQQTGWIASGLLKIRAVSVCDLLEHDLTALHVAEDRCGFRIPRRGLLVLRCHLGET